MGNGASGSGGIRTASRSKRPMHEMSEDEQLQAAMKASLEESTHNSNEIDGAATKMDTENNDDDDDDDYVEVLESKPPSFLDELMSTHVGEEPTTGARIQFRMADGKRLIRKFSPSDCVKIIYAFVAQSNAEAQGGREFSLMAGFPPSDLYNNIESTIENCKLSGETITVRWK